MNFSRSALWLMLTGCGLFAGSSVAAAESSETNLVWREIRTLDVEGKGWTNTQAFYDRLPARAEKLVRPPVWKLSHDSSGMLVRFRSDATAIHARWALRSPNLAMPHMAATGVSGLDLYVRTTEGKWRWLAVGVPRAQTNSTQLISGLVPGEREYLLYLPLYNGVCSVEVGVPKDASLRKAGPWGHGERKPILFYGTSILQGACASRPGMVHSSILGRRFNWPTINLGFSGNGKMEPELADLLAELGPSVYVLDCLPNMTADEVTERIEPFVRRLRQAHPNTPIILVEDRTYANSFLVVSKHQRQDASRAACQLAYRRLKRSGLKDLYYVKGEELLGNDGEATVDSSHPSDLGFERQAQVLAKALRPLLRSR